MSYEQIKTFVSDHRTQVHGLLVLVVVFFIGVGVGKISNTQNSKATKSYLEYNTNSPAKTIKADAPKEAVLDAATATPTPAITPEATPSNTAATTPAKPSTNCIVKGNVSSKDKIYHVKGGAFYDRVTPELCFATEAEAKLAGFRKSSR